MDLYRAMDKLSIGIAQYEAFPASRLKARNLRILAGKGAVAKIETPPIMAVWHERAERLREHEIDSFEALFDAEGFLDWKREALCLLTPSSVGCKHCGGK